MIKQHFKENIKIDVRFQTEFTRIINKHPIDEINSILDLKFWQKMNQEYFDSKATINELKDYFDRIIKMTVEEYYSELSNKIIYEKDKFICNS